jgi:hypothetical protein
MYYKIIKDGYVIDICDSWGKLSHRGNIINCRYEEAQFLIGLEPERYPYRVEWLMPLPQGKEANEIFECVLITKEEYEDLYLAFYNKKTIEYTPTQEEYFEEEIFEEINEEQETPRETLSYSELIRQISELSSFCKKLGEQNRLLEDCILEISQKLY